MSVLLFWNPLRLGQSTLGDRQTIMEGVLAEAFKSYHAEMAVLCEITGTTSLGDAPIRKQIFKRKRTRRQTSAQLGYAAIRSNLTTVETMTKLILDSYKETFGSPIRYRGGNSFTAQSKRDPAYVTTVAGTAVYVFHSNSSYKGAALTAWVAMNIGDEDFVLVGDFNCEPAALRNELGIDRNSFNIQDGGHTHNARHRFLTRTYDYAIAPHDKAIDVHSFDIRGIVEEMTGDRGDVSDHLPIVVTF
jgi:hypothetical protein